jgi:hypothetical protein
MHPAAMLQNHGKKLVWRYVEGLKFGMRLAMLLLLTASAIGQTATSADFTHCNSLLSTQDVLNVEHLSSADRSDLEMCRISEAMSTVNVRTGFDNKRYKLWRNLRRQLVPIWFDVRDAFCEFHPSAQYVDPFNNLEKCSLSAPGIHTDKAELDRLFAKSWAASEDVTGNMVEDLKSR